ncbi:MAG: 16S rRNA (adenine(1518)-N(6)/adenine(1519)-N(6))-dimethyltransferase RsmA [Magnetococcales bacterium]|nr:16S rRNA (adenine(1518)-N(6)/adenine(1519)-N(6))-dimethyltransferase RsmA [Magnetococcales bacterium]MBF0151933.1 16S rRNA (adenine(1518)-N(6)/adenine(1519)-N(6))-dimethyltransferase RsmA [Magnetococcales bacterium]MBF0172991.1 16S rRNA (adenine(1518)-N(6)/adenine(1519)-N(6))-dimethyltransferase RsmA [Magnetococcales bacterium]
MEWYEKAEALGGRDLDLSLELSLPALIRHLGLLPRKGMGQNFLVDENIAEKIVRSSGIRREDRVVEIGPGLGSLTRPLSRRVERLTVIELDSSLLPVLRQRIGDRVSVRVIQADALRFDFLELGETLGGSIHIVANLPYNISSPLLIHLLDHRRVIDSMTLMFQKEVAERITASPGGRDYGSLSVQVAQWMEVERLFDVGAGAFFPVPKVQSTVVHFRRRLQPLAELDDEGVFRNVVRTAFGQRRKTLANALRPMHSDTKTWLAAANIDSSRRAETLQVVEFARLANMWKDQ